MSDDLPVKRWRVMIDNFADWIGPAPTRSAARYAAYKAVREAGYFGDVSFKRFLQNSLITEWQP